MNRNVERRASIERQTGETRVKVDLILDGSGKYRADTGIGFFNHMLAQLSRHSGWDLEIEAKGDLEIDGHHTVEDVGITLGQALAQALGDKTGVTRFASARVPLDEALAEAVVDLSGRPFLVFRASFPSLWAGELETELVREFFRALSDHAKITLHLKVEYGDNTHHMVEALFKAAARALGAAVAFSGRNGIPSTKGVL